MHLSVVSPINYVKSATITEKRFPELLYRSGNTGCCAGGDSYTGVCGAASSPGFTFRHWHWFILSLPFGTGIGIAIVSLLVALQNFWLGVEVLVVAVAIDQVNSNFVAPRILGDLTGLNPVWVVISLLVGAKLGGVLGLLIAIPTASFIKDIADSWRAGAFYHLHDVEPESAKVTTDTAVIHK